MDTPLDSDPQLLASDLQRDETPDVTEKALRTLVRGNTGFALDLLDELGRESLDDNLLFSPYSISVAIAMTWAGARRGTERQIADALRYPFGQERLHPAFNELEQKLERHDGSESESREDERVPFQLDVVDSIWSQKDYPFREAYLNILAVNYGAGLRTLDFRTDPERARTRINEWITEQTNGRIERLLPPDSIIHSTRLVLTDTIYFKANWEHTFSKEATKRGTFTALDGTTSSVPLMRQTDQFPYVEVDGHQLIELPYVGNVGMVVILPARGEFERFEGSLDTDRLTTLLDSLEHTGGKIVFPRFRYDSRFQLKDALSALGMQSAFDAAKANFGGMADTEQADGNLFINNIIQKSHIAVDEEGTEAAAATAVITGVTATPIRDPFEMVVDRPFLYLIRDRTTETILFLGRVSDAEAASNPKPHSLTRSISVHRFLSDWKQLTMSLSLIRTRYHRSQIELMPK